MLKAVFVRKMLVFLLVFGVGVTSYAQSFIWGGGPISIKNGPPCWTDFFVIPVSGLPLISSPPCSSGGFGLESISIQGSGRYASDLDLWLYPPGLAGIEITTGNGVEKFGRKDAGGNYISYTCFDMRATVPIIGSMDNPMEGPYLPEGDLDLANNGTDPNGTWVIAYLDNTCFQGFSLNEVILTFGNCSDPTISPCYSGTLPIELLSFTGEAQNEYNLLNWSTASETNNDYFIVENSNDGITFKELTIVAGGGNSNSTIEYSYQHFRPSATEYYRLKQVDFDGQSEYSKIVAVSSNGQFDLVIFPNPSKGSLSFSVNEGTDNVYTVMYTNVLGKAIEETVNISQGPNTYQLKGFEDLDRGIYAVHIFNKEQKILTSQKIVKQ